MRHFCALLLFAFVFSGCSEQGLTDAALENSSVSNEAAMASQKADFQDITLMEDALAASKKDDLVEICHVPNGNEDQPQTMMVSASAASRHLQNHADFEGSCDGPANLYAPEITNIPRLNVDDLSWIEGGTPVVLSATVTDADGNSTVTSVEACFYTTVFNGLEWEYTISECVSMDSGLDPEDGNWSATYTALNPYVTYYWMVSASDDVHVVELWEVGGSAIAFGFNTEE